LFEEGVEFGVAGLAEVGFAVSVAGADDGRDLLIDGVLDGVEGAEVVAVAGIDEVDLRAPGDGAGVLEIEVGLGFVTVGVDLGGTWKFAMSLRLTADWPITAMDWLEPV
jgi:hypothetical protein